MIPDKCPHCGVGPDPERGESRWECGTEHRYHFRGSRCHEREADALRVRVRELEGRVEQMALNNLASMLHFEQMNRKIANLIKAGNGLRAIVWRDYRGTEFCDDWDRAKEAKP